MAAGEQHESAEAELARNVLAALDGMATDQRELRKQVNSALLTLATRQIELEELVKGLGDKVDSLAASDTLCWRQVQRVVIAAAVLAALILIGYLLFERAGML